MGGVDEEGHDAVAEEFVEVAFVTCGRSGP